MNINKLFLLISSLLFCGSAAALESDYKKPIHVSSIKQHAKMKKNTVIFLNEVLLTQGTIKIACDKLTVIRAKNPNHEKMVAEGKPATFYQTQDDGRPFNAQANSISYDIAEGKITLAGNAQVKQLDSQINGSEIIYFLETKELTVNTGTDKDERVNTVFLPAQFEESEKDAAASSTEKEE